MSRPRLMVFASHPIQYQSPWFRALAKDGRIDLKVVFAYVPSDATQGIGFGTRFTWDVPLRDGYESEVLSCLRLAPEGSRFASGIGRGVAAALRRFRPDAVLVMGWHDLVLVQAFLACKLLRIPAIMRGEANDKRTRAGWKSALQGLYVRQASAALAIGDASAAFYAARGVPPDRIHMARYFVDNDRFRAEAARLRPERAALRARWEIEDGAFTVAFVGKMEPKKRVMDVLDALAIARRGGAPVHGLFVGSGVQMEDARSKAAAEGIPVTFTGFLNQTEIPSAYVAADALALPSDFGETWGLVCNEAMACGTPVIVSERAGCADDLVVNGETGGVVPFADPAAMAAVIARWCGDKETHEGICRRAVRHVSDRYSIEQAMAGLYSAMAAITHLDGSGSDLKAKRRA
ncbi:MAG: glycosyltransferase family 4 protein [Burkholderiales bacterium]|nr:glycosyltransferase family 4 protein [Burkholderiales bacterium]